MNPNDHITYTRIAMDQSKPAFATPTEFSANEGVSRWNSIVNSFDDLLYSTCNELKVRRLNLKA